MESTVHFGTGYVYIGCGSIILEKYNVWKVIWGAIIREMEKSLVEKAPSI